jgi:hypothetical protein
MTQWLYWCTTPSGENDYWVVAENAPMAKAFFAGMNGFQSEFVRAERIRKRLPGDLPTEPELVLNISPVCPTKKQLERWGVHYNSHFHVFSIGKRIFRPEGLVRALMISAAMAANRRRREGRGLPSKTVSSF